MHWNKKFGDQMSDFLKDRFKLKKLDLLKAKDHIDKKFLLKKHNSEDNRSPLNAALIDFCKKTNPLYMQFLSWIRLNVVKEDFYFQKMPTIRVHMPEMAGCGLSYEQAPYPAWHSDCLLGHNPREINIWFGISNNMKSDFWVTDVKFSREWLVKYGYSREAFIKDSFGNIPKFNNYGFAGAIEVENIFNSIFLFDSRCIHTAVDRTNRDHTTKFSIDIRIILKKDYEWVIINDEPVFVGTGHRRAEFRPGHPYGYHGHSIDNILLNL